MSRKFWIRRVQESSLRAVLPKREHRRGCALAERKASNTLTPNIHRLFSVRPENSSSGCPKSGFMLLRCRISAHTQRKTAFDSPRDSLDVLFTLSCGWLPHTAAMTILSHAADGWELAGAYANADYSVLIFRK